MALSRKIQEFVRREIAAALAQAGFVGGTYDAARLGGSLPSGMGVPSHTHSGDDLLPESVEITGGPLATRGDITPAQITADQNDYNPTGLADAVVLRLSSDAARSITGLAGGADGRVLTLHNVGTENISLVGESALSAAANRFALASGFTVRPDDGVILQYDATESRWRCIGHSIDTTGGGGGGGAQTVYTVTVATVDTHTTGSTWEDINSLSLVVPTVTGDKVFVMATIKYTIRSTGSWHFALYRLTVDGTPAPNVWQFSKQANPVAGETYTITFHEVLDGLAPGNHTIKAQWHDSGSNQDVDITARRLTAWIMV